MKAEDYLKEHRIYDDEIIYNNVGDIVGTLSQIMNDYHESEVKKLNMPSLIVKTKKYDELGPSSY